ncbi:putative transcriptional regulatory protein [Fusarium oxysporum f. sp. cubense]|uniref:Putative transcriptional regulatory protein n=1 Tax=Fusarium oxysporum f. sp. cubense TaxID=61366 RepID=A0A559LLI3_FUSOC|nr:putative transcriptional regulatory protein [Fusarium oxysporum f. sp. cubense]
MGRFKGRSTVACTVCHSQKLKCDGERAHPCGRCARRQRECVYPVKTTYVTVPEAYLRDLERTAASSRPSSSLTSSFTDDLPDYSGQSQSPSDPGTSTSSRVAARAIISDDCSAERFVYDLRQMALPESPDGLQQQGGYSYAVLKSDLIEPRILIKLPSASLAMKLLDTFEEIFCDHHWFLRRDFRERVQLLFTDPKTQSQDRSWLSRASLVFALATTFMYGSQPSGELTTEQSENPTPPGSDLFEQAVALLNVSSEEPTTEDVEALNLMAFYCYSLNRRRMAYKYATQSLAVAKLLFLDRTPNLSASGQEVIIEHRKRLWWTSFCMERMVVAELGLAPAHAANRFDAGLPSSRDIPESEMDQFFDPSVQTLQTQICEIKCQIMESVGHLRQVSDLETMLFDLWPCFDTLRSWKEKVPSYISFDFKSGVPEEMSQRSCARGLASLYLRYHQCFTVLLRPFFSKKLSLRLQGVDSDHLESRLNATMRQRIQVLTKEGHDAARNNCKILIDLFHRGKHARFGYWDSVHAFSSLSIISIARAVAPELAETSELNDEHLYSQCRLILKEMAEAGNPAARDHNALLADLDSIVQMLTTNEDAGPIERPAEFEVPSLEFCEGLWSDVDWVEFLNNCSQWA